MIKHGHSKHGHESLTYKTWSAVIQRCTNPNASHYEYYGGRGITVCERWKIFINFLEDMGERPAGSTIDRINTNGNYEPSNCRWATKSQQERNMRNSRLLTAFGKTMALADWADTIGMNRTSLHARLRRGFSVERALTQKVKRLPKHGSDEVVEVILEVRK